MRSQIQDNVNYIASKQQEQERLRTQFEADLERFRELKAAQAKAMEQMGHAAPTAAAK
jgi:flagellar motor component MotA